MSDDILELHARISGSTKENKMKHSLLQFFEYKHLPQHLQAVSKPFGELAQTLVTVTPSNAEQTTSLRKLLEAKDCAVRSLLFKEEVKTRQFPDEDEMLGGYCTGSNDNNG